MSIETISLVTTPASAGTARARTLTIWAGRTSVAIGVAHIAAFTAKTWPRWGDWIGGGLHGEAAIKDPANAASMAEFWALPGSFAVPLILLGLLVARMARTGQEIPRYLGWTVGAWVLLGAWILEPSGFPLGLIPTTLLLLAQRASSRRGSSPAQPPA